MSRVLLEPALADVDGMSEQHGGLVQVPLLEWGKKNEQQTRDGDGHRSPTTSAAVTSLSPQPHTHTSHVAGIADTGMTAFSRILMGAYIRSGVFLCALSKRLDYFVEQR